MIRSDFPFSWSQMIAKSRDLWERSLQSPKHRRILFCSNIGALGSVLTHDTMLGAALTMRGADVHFLLCDGALALCEACTLRNSIESDVLGRGIRYTHCKPCFSRGRRTLMELGLPIHEFGTFFDLNDQYQATQIVHQVQDRDLRSFTLDGLELGEDAHAGALRYFAIGDLDGEQNGLAILRQYLQSAVLTYSIINRVIDRVDPDLIVLHHGIYVPQGIISKVASKRGVPRIIWAPGYRARTFIYSHGETYHRSMITEPVKEWQSRELSSDQETHLMEYLEHRRTGKSDWIRIATSHEQDMSVVRNRLGLDSRPLILILTNVGWDAQLYYTNNAFPTQTEWLLTSIDYFRTRPDLQVIIRIHPAEVLSGMPSRQPMKAVIESHVPSLPENIRIIDANVPCSTYTLGDLCDTCIIYGTKAGVELTARGIPVIVAGEAWIKNKGLTVDPKSRTEYLQVLTSLPRGARLPPSTTRLARQYAYHYFFRRLTPLKAICPAEETFVGTFALRLRRLYNSISVVFRRRRSVIMPCMWTIAIRRLEELQPGVDSNLDAVCGQFLDPDAVANESISSHGTS